ncbi:MAG TPA: endopeptidase La [Pseudomonadota bacterium]|nr:endopeptidase La [Pseudomonadota bacterium]
MTEPLRETQDSASPPLGALPAALPPTSAVLPTRDLVLFPYMVAPLMISRSISAAAVQRALATPERVMFVCLQRQAEQELPGPTGLHAVGTLATILRVTPLSDGRTKLVVQGLQRARVQEWLEQSPCMVVRPTPLPAREEALPSAGTTDPRERSERTEQIERAELRSRLLGGAGGLGGEPASVELQALQRQIKEDLDRYARADKVRAPELTELLHGFDETVPERFADLVAANLHIPPAEAQHILETVDVAGRLRLLGAFLRRELQLLDLQEGIRARTKEVLSRAQREHFLSEQLRQIHTELDGGGDELGELRGQLRAAGMSGEALAEAERQLRRLEAMPAQSPEAQVVRAHLTWLVELPWRAVTEDRFDLGSARRALDEEHADLDAVKQRILEFLSVMRLRRGAGAGKGGRDAGSILCFVGPPGVGKTTLGRSIARALGRRFVRVQLGGVRDDAEVRGHRRTYVGALPGRLIQGLRQAGTRNPVMLLDELDKLCSDSHGDPAAALLEVLDPEQNSAFRDHYLGVPFDLSEILFIATANSLDRIPPALRDRLEVLPLSGYTDQEKLTIATRHLVPRAIFAAGLAPTYKVRITAPALRTLISRYTHEAGLRERDRQLAALCRKLAHQVVAEECALKGLGAAPPVGIVPTHDLPAEAAALPSLTPVVPPGCQLLTVTQKSLTRLLGPPPPTRFTLDPAASAQQPPVGLCVGLAWTPAGGEVLTVETQSMPGPGGLRLTGQLGEVMRESAQTALSYARAFVTRTGCADPFVQNHELHVHVPAGAIPKDGPSAGVTIACALVSLLAGRPVRPGVAMTGEVTLRGRVLAVGGLKEKLLAAQRAGIHTVLIPRENQPDLASLPRSLTRAVQLILVGNMEELLREALVSGSSAQHTRTHSPAASAEGAEKSTHGAGRKRTA